MWTAILAALSAALNAWRQERLVYNSPEMIKNKLDIARQDARDALAITEATLSNPNATPEQHAEALRALRLAGS